MFILEEIAERIKNGEFVCLDSYTGDGMGNWKQLENLKAEIADHLQQNGIKYVIENQDGETWISSKEAFNKAMTEEY